MEKKILVKILSNKYIMGFGVGPIRKPIWLSENKVKQLVLQGHKIEIVSEEKVDISNIVETTVNEEAIVEPAVNEEVIEETIESEEVIVEPTVNEEVIEETIESEEVIENDENLSADAYYTDEFLTKKKCMTILTNRNIAYDEKDTAENLKKLVLETNPEVIFE